MATDASAAATTATIADEEKPGHGKQRLKAAGWYLLLSATVAALLLSGTYVLW